MYLLGNPPPSRLDKSKAITRNAPFLPRRGKVTITTNDGPDLSQPLLSGRQATGRAGGRSAGSMGKSIDYTFGVLSRTTARLPFQVCSQQPRGTWHDSPLSLSLPYYPDALVDELSLTCRVGGRRVRCLCSEFFGLIIITFPCARIQNRLHKPRTPEGKLHDERSLGFRVPSYRRA